MEWVFGEVVRAPRPGGGAGAPGARGAAGRAGHREQALTLDDGRVLAGLGAVVLAQGHLPAEADGIEESLAAYADRHGLRYYAPANPPTSTCRRSRRASRCRCAGWGSTSSTTWRC
ncbi:hypothetical protein NKH77_16100 [Streptomyces sp. M19]